MTQPLSALYLNVALDKEILSKCKYNKDLTLFYFLLKHGTGRFLNEPMGVYRSHSNGVWTGSSRQNRILADLRCIIGIYDVDLSKEAAFLLTQVSDLDFMPFERML